MGIGKDIIKQIQKETECNQIRIKLDTNKKPGIMDSKVGGIPYWPAGKEYPKDSDGNPMLLLAQINCEQLPKTGELPEHGILQFFVSCADAWSEGKVVYHTQEDVDRCKNVSGEIVDFRSDKHKDAPVRKECAMMFALETGYMSYADMSIDDRYKHAVETEYKNDPNVPKTVLDVLHEMSDEELEQHYAPSEGHHLLGYPYFTQSDPRELNGKYDRLLFQLDSENRGKNWLVIWGDVGVGNFFINSDALKNCDFSDVFFTWDCC